ncbi:unnamed protein product [Amoebophrya sp. A120]|nr:unnamed protein product [Amoebophrya sp. A120]|eukprot:GSA120T00000156001.1
MLDRGDELSVLSGTTAVQERVFRRRAASRPSSVLSQPGSTFRRSIISLVVSLAASTAATGALGAPVSRAADVHLRGASKSEGGKSPTITASHEEDGEASPKKDHEKSPASVSARSAAQPRQLHPGAIAYGRASCGVEYSVPQNAYRISNVKEAFFIRRVQTLEHPYFWTEFDVTETNQDVYLCAWTPEIARFRDRLFFNGYIFGPGLPQLTASHLERVTRMLIERGTLAPEEYYDQTAWNTAGILQPKDPFYRTGRYFHAAADTKQCANIGVQNSPVMSGYATDRADHYDPSSNQCMQELPMASDYKDFLLRSATVYDYWLYSTTHYVGNPGKYKVVTWLVADENAVAAAGSGASAIDVTGINVLPGSETAAYNRPVVTGKYELTIGPHSWMRYASDADLAATQSQGTTCSCSVNALDWQEQHVSRLGMFGRTFWEQQLPFAWLAAVPALDAGLPAKLPASPSTAGGTHTDDLRFLPKGAKLEERLAALLALPPVTPAYSYNALYRAPWKHQEHGLAGVATGFADANLGVPVRSSACITKPKMASLPSSGKNLDLIEWSGVFQLEYGKTYFWNWHGYRELAESSFRYPDAAVDVLLVREPQLSCVTADHSATTLLSDTQQAYLGQVTTSARAGATQSFVQELGDAVSTPPNNLKDVSPDFAAAGFDGSAVSKQDGDFLDFERTQRVYLNSTLKRSHAEMNGGARALDVWTQTMDGAVSPAQPSYATQQAAMEGTNQWHFSAVDTTVKIFQAAPAPLLSHYYFLSVYTQHRPEEFVGAYLQEVDSDLVVRKYVFPTAEQVYAGDGTSPRGGDMYSNTLQNQACDRRLDEPLPNTTTTTTTTTTTLPTGAAAHGQAFAGIVASLLISYTVAALL